MFHETPYARLGDAVPTAEYEQGREWRRGWNDAALGREPVIIPLPKEYEFTSEIPELVIVLSKTAFNLLPEYSASMPSGEILGKRWRRREPWGSGWHSESRPTPISWYMGEYCSGYDAQLVLGNEVGTQVKIGIRWYRIVMDNIRDEMRLMRGGKL
jgi:hypothetical protein